LRIACVNLIGRPAPDPDHFFAVAAANLGRVFLCSTPHLAHARHDHHRRQGAGKEFVFEAYDADMIDYAKNHVAETLGMADAALLRKQYVI
jgi:hypothetical protein